jgi:hypothetical protein
LFGVNVCVESRFSSHDQSLFSFTIVWWRVVRNTINFS